MEKCCSEDAVGIGKDRQHTVQSETSTASQSGHAVDNSSVWFSKA